MRGSGLWTYGILNLIHILGIALLFGAITLLDLRLLGLWRSIPLASLSRPAVTVAGTGFAIAAMTGPAMLSTNAMDYVGNYFLPLKFIFIALALINILILHRSAAWKAHRTRELTIPEQRRLAVMGGCSLFFWLGAVTCGRMIGYW